MLEQLCTKTLKTLITKSIFTDTSTSKTHNSSIKVYEAHTRWKKKNHSTCASGSIYNQYPLFINSVIYRDHEWITDCGS